jgi:hypothetical protein
MDTIVKIKRIPDDYEIGFHYRLTPDGCAEWW